MLKQVTSVKNLCDLVLEDVEISPEVSALRYELLENKSKSEKIQQNLSGQIATPFTQFEEMNIKNSVLQTDELKTDKKDKYKALSQNIMINNYTNEINYNDIEMLLEKEKNNNKKEAWNKLDKTVKIQKLHAFAEKYCKEHNLSIKDAKALKLFFIQSLEKNKLQKTKEVNYDKDTREIISIPALFFNTTNHNFTLKITDTKRVSTIKSLTPKRLVYSASMENLQPSTL